MTDSILKTIRKTVIGMPINSQNPDEEAAFDTDLIMHINTAFAILAQLGAGPDGGFSITDDSAMWSDYIVVHDKLSGEIAQMVKTYVTLKVRLLFDPPANSSAVEQMNKSAAECEWRICEGYAKYKID